MKCFEGEIQLLAKTDFEPEVLHFKMLMSVFCRPYQHIRYWKIEAFGRLWQAVLGHPFNRWINELNIPIAIMNAMQHFITRLVSWGWASPSVRSHARLISHAIFVMLTSPPAFSS